MEAEHGEAVPGGSPLPCPPLIFNWAGPPLRGGVEWGRGFRGVLAGAPFDIAPPR